jgi:hypothetical protein
LNDEPQMTDEQDAPPRKSYAAPRLIQYGRALDLVGGGTGSVQEGVEMAVMKFP